MHHEPPLRPLQQGDHSRWFLGIQRKRVHHNSRLLKESKGNEYILPWTRQAVLDAYKRANMTKDDIDFYETAQAMLDAGEYRELAQDWMID